MKVDFPAIQTKHTEEEVRLISESILNAKSLSMGAYLKEFEDNFASYLDVKHAFGVSNATSGLDLTAIISGVNEGDEVIVPVHTFTASALPFLKRKAKLIFADIDPETFVIDVADIESKITEKTKVIVAVHLYGVPAAMDKIMDLARANNILVVEDCAQAPGAEYKGKKVGTWGDFGCFSFHGQKNITTLGEGGMIVTNNDDFANKILGLRKIGARPFENQEKYWKPAMSNIIEAIPGEFPENYALGEIQAFAGNLILKRIDDINERRANYYNRFKDELKDYSELKFQKVPTEAKSSYHLLPARFVSDYAHRDDLIDMLFTEYGIKTVVQYYPLDRYELFMNNGYAPNTCRKSDEFFDNMISFPFMSDMEDSMIDYMINSIKECINKLRNNGSN